MQAILHGSEEAQAEGAAAVQHSKKVGRGVRFLLLPCLLLVLFLHRGSTLKRHGSQH